MSESSESLLISEPSPPAQVIEPAQEVAAYEALWTKLQTVAKMASLFEEYGHALPSFIARKKGITDEHVAEIKTHLRGLMPFDKYSALFYRDFEYPDSLRVAKHPVEVLYFQGAPGLLSRPAVSVVGARKATRAGILRARRLAKLLVEHNYTVMSGLAEGIDTAAHTEALASGGRTVAVIGTPLSEYYPKSNIALQDRIAKDFLLVSQVPFYFHSLRDYRDNRKFFPERNKTMCALSVATCIVEASDTSGTLFQARAAIEQGRKLFILKSCFETGLAWPQRFLEKGAIKVAEPDDILAHLPKVSEKTQ